MCSPLGISQAPGIVLDLLEGDVGFFMICSVMERNLVLLLRDLNQERLSRSVSDLGTTLSPIAAMPAALFEDALFMSEAGFLDILLGAFLLTTGGSPMSIVSPDGNTNCICCFWLFQKGLEAEAHADVVEEVLVAFSFFLSGVTKSTTSSSSSSSSSDDDDDDDDDDSKEA